MKRCPIAGRLGVVAAAAALMLLTPADADAARLRSTLSVKVEVVERCSATSSGGQAQLRGCPKTTTLRTHSAPAAAGRAPGVLPVMREVAADEEVRYLTVIY